MDRTLVTKLILDASSYKKGVDLAKQATASINKELELWKTKNSATANSLRGLSQQAKANADTQKVLASQIDITKKKLDEITKSKTAASREAIFYKNKLTDLEIQQAKLNKEVGGSISHMQNFKNGLVAVGSQLKTIGTQITSVGKSMSMYITAPLVAAGSVGIGFNSMMEQARISFTTLLGDAEKGKALVNELKAFADVTPFAVTDLTGSAQMLLSYGVAAEKIMPDIKMLGDVAMGNKDKFNNLSYAYAQIQAAGRLMGQDLRQLVNAGFNPLQVISQKTGMSLLDLKKKMEDGAISADMVTAAFKIVTSEGGLFYKGTESASKTFSGQWSTLKDTVNSALGEVVKPLFEYLTNTLLPKVIVKIKALQEWWIKLGEKTQKTILTFIGVAAALGPLLVIVGQIAGGIGGLMVLLGAMSGPAKIAVAAIGAVAVGLGILYVTSEDARNAMNGLASFLKTEVPKAANAVVEVFGAIGDAWSRLKSRLNLSGIPDTVLGFLVGGPLGLMVGSSADAFNFFKNKGASESEGIKNKFMGALKGAFKKMGSGATTAGTGAKELEDYYKKLFDSIKDGSGEAGKGVDTFKNSIKSMVDAIKQQTTAFANFVGLFDTFERKSVSGTRLLNRLKAQITAMMDWRNALGNLEKRGVSEAFLSDLRSMGPQAVDSISALSRMSDEQLKQYTGLYNQKYALAGGESSKAFAATQKAETLIEKQLVINATGSKADAETIANAIVKKLRAAGYAF